MMNATLSLLSMQSCALSETSTSLVTLERCNSTYFSVIAWDCMCETCQEPFVVAGDATMRFCHHIPNCAQMRQCTTCKAPWNWVCGQCDEGYHLTGRPEYLCARNKEKWKWDAPFRWLVSLIRPIFPALPAPDGSSGAMFSSHAMRARAAARVEEAQIAAKVLAKRAAEKADDLAQYFEAPPANWLEQSRVGEHWRLAWQSSSGGRVSARLYVNGAFAMISIIDLLSGLAGPLVFAKGDMNSNANTLQQLTQQASADASLQDLVEAELASGVPVPRLISDGRTAMCSLLWLNRALRLLHVMLRTFEADRRVTVKECLLKGYEESLKPFHGLVGRTTFAVAARSAPERRWLIANLGRDADTVFVKLRALIDDVAKVLSAVEAFLIDKGLEVGRTNRGALVGTNR